MLLAGKERMVSGIVVVVKQTMRVASFVTPKLSNSHRFFRPVDTALVAVADVVVACLCLGEIVCAELPNSSTVSIRYVRRKT